MHFFTIIFLRIIYKCTNYTLTKTLESAIIFIIIYKSRYFHPHLHFTKEFIMIGLIVSAVIVLIFLLSVGGSYVFGKINAKFRCLSIVTAALSAFIGALIVKFNMSSGWALNIVIDYLKSAGEATTSETLAELSEVTVTLLSVIGSLTAPIIFLVFFIIFSIIAFITSVIVWFCKMIASASNPEKKKNGFITRLVTGAVSGLVVTTCLLIPISAYSRVAAIALPELEHSGIVEKDSEVASIITEVDEAIVVKSFRIFGGSLMTNALTNINLNDENSVTTVKLADETQNLATLYSHILSLSETKLEDYSDKEAEAILAIGDDFAHSKLITKLSCETLFALTEAWKNGEDFIGIQKPDMGETFAPIFDELILISNSDSQNDTYLGEDITTIAQLVSHLANSGVFAKLDQEPTELIHTLTDNGVISDLITTLNSNQRMKRLIPILSNVGFSVISDSIGIPADKNAVYNDMMSDIADTINVSASLEESERAAKIAETIMATTHDAGMDIAETEATILADSLIKYFGSNTSVTSADVATFFAEVGAAMSESGSSSIAFTGTPAFSKLNSSSAYSAEAGDLLQKLAEAALITDESARKNAINAAVNGSELYASASADAKKALIEIASNASAEIMAASLENAAALQSSEKAIGKIKKITLSDINFNLDLYLNSSATSDVINNDMTALFINAATIVKNLASINNSESGAMNFSVIAEALGKILDILASNDIYGKEKTHDLFEAIISSGIISDATGLSRAEIDKLIESTIGITKYSTVVGAMADITSVADGMQNNSLESDHIQSLIGNLDHESVVVVDTLITSEKLKESGLNAKDPEQATEVVHKLFGELSAIQNEELFETEANAVEHLLELATVASHTTKEDKIFGEGGVLGVTATQVIEELHLSSAVCSTFEYSNNTAGTNPFGIDMNENDKAEFSAACEQYLKENPTDEAKEFINNTKTFFDIQ